ncbi:MAG: alpha/beta hydrolase domain-containing protein, partial [Alphaproteobacteria bacterium]
MPIAKNPDGSPVTGKVLARIVDTKPGVNTMPLAILGRAIPYDAASLDTTKARLIRKTWEKRSGELGPIETVSSSQWAFGDCRQSAFPGKADPRSLCLKDGFDANYLYELVYDAKNPLVLGIGLAAIRDLASFFRYEQKDSDGSANPVAGKISNAIIKGVSQSGNTLKTFLLLGFNDGENSKIVFDGANPHIAGRLTTINVRFGVPSGSGTLYEPGGEGVLWWTAYTDAARGRKEASLLDRCKASDTCPKIFETFGAAEFNARLMTVALTGTDSKSDLPLPENVRRYYFPGNTHGGADETSFARMGKPSKSCVLFENPNFQTEQMNALGVALADWVKSGKEPPQSVYPKLANGDLAANTKEAMGYP